MIDVFIKLANDEIKDQTILKVYDHTGDMYTYTFDKKFKEFYDEYNNEMIDDFKISNKFLNYEVELIQPKEKKYFVKFNMRWWIERFSYLNYYEKNESVELNTKQSSVFCKASFTKDELQSIQPVREFLEDMKGKYELVEVEENENN